MHQFLPNNNFWVCLLSVVVSSRRQRRKPGLHCNLFAGDLCGERVCKLVQRFVSASVWAAGFEHRLSSHVFVFVLLGLRVESDLVLRKLLPVRQLHFDKFHGHSDM